MTFPSTVQAVAIDKTGGIDVLEKKSLPFPKQEPNHIVVKVRPTRIDIVLNEAHGLLRSTGEV